MKNPETKKAVMAEALKAAKAALEAGATQEESIIAAENAIVQQLTKYREIHNVREGIKRANIAIQDAEE